MNVNVKVFIVKCRVLILNIVNRTSPSVRILKSRIWGQGFSNINVFVSLLRILLKYRYPFRQSKVNPKILHLTSSQIILISQSIDHLGTKVIMYREVSRMGSDFL